MRGVFKEDDVLSMFPSIYLYILNIIFTVD